MDNKWVHVDDYLPEYGVMVLAGYKDWYRIFYLEDYGDYLAWENCSNWYNPNVCELDDFSDITHWMALPSCADGSNEALW